MRTIIISGGCLVNFQNQQAQQNQQARQSFQPTGYVQSVYQGQNRNNQQQPQQPQQQQQNQFQTPQSFHAANYQGNQPGHDQYLRADSTQPSQQSQYRAFGQIQSGMRQQMPGQQQFSQNQ